MLKGIIHASIGNYESLQPLYLTDNKLTGRIPSSIFQLKNVTKLTILSNDLKSNSISLNIDSCKDFIRL